MTLELVGNSEQMRQVRREIERLAARELPIHLTGASGVGKELVAQALHAASPRSSAPFVAVNCVAMPDTLLESGKLAFVDGETLFLDEVADLSLAAQAKLLRVLEDGELARVISATHKDLKQAVVAGTFREDLYYRLVGAVIAIPRLCQRGTDVIELAEAFLAQIRAKRPAPARLSSDAIAALTTYTWPGNVRELRHAIERACAIADGDTIEVANLALPVPRQPAVTAGTLATRFAALDETERRLVKEAMARAQGNVSEAARLLGISRIMMRRRLDRYGTDEGEL